MLDRAVSRALVLGSVATATSVLALAVAARIEGRGTAQPLNATSHWLHGDKAARRRDSDVEHTLVGFATHALATVFWAVFYEAWLIARPTRDPTLVVGRAVAIGALAAVVDYTITPHRFTPGWELVLSKRSMAVVYAAMSAGFAATALISPAHE